MTTGVGATYSIAGESAARVTAGAGGTYSITGEIDMGCETETSIVKCVLNRSCLEQMRQGFLNCADPLAPAPHAQAARARLRPSTCDGVSQTQHVIKKLGLALRCLVSPPSVSWSTSLDVCGFAQAKRTCLAPSAHKD